MSDSTVWDEPRTVVKEWIKKYIVSHYAAAFVAGSPHRDYLMRLGLPDDRIFLGYDVVDNHFFGNRVKKIKDSEACIQDSRAKTGSRSYFLASARFVEKKNLIRLIRAYAIYREKVKLSTIDHRPLTDRQPWDLVLLGDGILRPDLCSLISELGLQDSVHLPGFKKYEELPAYYAAAGAFIHASTTDQWGLVVNEAMASGLPILVSNRCGCASDLVKEGVNGWMFDPFNLEQLAELMLRASSNHDFMNRMGAKSQVIIASWGLDRFVQGVLEAGGLALNYEMEKIRMLDRLLLACISGLLMKK